MNDVLYHLVLERLLADHALEAAVVELVDAACHGESELGAALDASAQTTPPTLPAHGPAPAPVEPPGAYLARIQVAGFRGIADAATLELKPGPGLTLVLGRNGSGKSTFAEGLETLLTGESGRWEKRRQVAWREGWKNLHTEGGRFLEATFLTEGSAPVVVRRSWSADGALDAGKLTVRQGQKTLEAGLGALGWDEALETYRPFLSYTELGTLLFEEPSRLYDTLASMLGLGDVAEARTRVSKRRKEHEDDKKRTDEQLKALRPRLEAVDDPRATACVKALAGRQWDLDAVQQAVLGGHDAAEQGGLVAALQRLGQLVRPDLVRLDTACKALSDALQRVEALAGTDAARSDRLASLLEQALRYHTDYEGDCPVCGGQLPAAWADSTRQAIDEARELAAEVKNANGVRDAALRALRAELRPVPEGLRHAPAVAGLGDDLLTLWEAWSKAPLEPAALLEHVTARALVLDEAIEALRQEARARLAEMEDRWRPLAEELAAWLVGARHVLANAEARKNLKKAEDWLKDAEAALRDARFAPIADRAQHIWSELRYQSNVDLATVRLDGTSNRRRVELNVKVDGENSVALSVMSQGELNALALSLFLPRMTLAESPFRFLVIDDPVQAMDPAKVDGLARVLEEEARTRQVIVFTHDARLEEAVRRLQIDAHVLRVHRRARSQVAVETAVDPVERYLSDAISIAKSVDVMGLQVVRRLVPGFCRSALEAAALEAVRRRRLTRGDDHADVQQAIDDVDRLQELAAFALFDDPARGGDVFGQLNRKSGKLGVDAFRACKEGAHDGWDGDYGELIKEIRRVAKVLRSAS